MEGAHTNTRLYREREWRESVREEEGERREDNTLLPCSLKSKVSY